MASANVMAEIESAVRAAWTYTPIFANNITANVPEDNSAYLIITYPYATETMKSTGAPGSNVFREEGAALISLQIEAGNGLSNWPSLIDGLRSALRAKKLGDVNTMEAPAPFIDYRSDEGAYFVLSFALAYWFDTFG